MRQAVIVGVAVVIAGAGLVAGQEPEAPTDEQFTLRCFVPARRGPQLEIEKQLNATASAQQLKAWHEMLADVPHIAGSEGDLETIADIVRKFEAMGLEVETHWFWPFLSTPVDAQLEIVSPEQVSLPVREPPIEGDPFSTHPNLTIGFNGYSGSGDVTAGVVYANYGRIEDFEKLAELGVEVKGKIVLARYGGNFRGFKAKYAEAAGAAGLVIYTDPLDSGYGKGLMYPEGGWANSMQIQRGSLKTLPFPGDPLTPFTEASQSARRIEPEDAMLPTIPVQPVGWAAAEAILEQMTGEAVPEGWQGGLPFAYRLTGGADLRVRLRVEQERRIVKTANVIAKLEGATYPDELVIVGCHHDAWCHGASDPLSGMMVVMEAARCFSELAAQGMRPDRTILFCAWGAEEHGVIGSVEWVEANRQMLLDHGVAYINLDAATMGPNFRASGAPILHQLILDAAASVPQARDVNKTALENWMEQSGARDDGADRPPIGGMGGGSDHQGFYFHCGIPSIFLGSGGASGTAYHSNSDNLHWYQQVVGEDYQPALMVTRAVNVALARLTRADVLPFDPRDYIPDLRAHFEPLFERTEGRMPTSSMDSTLRALNRLEISTTEAMPRLLDAIDTNALDRAGLEDVNAQVMMALERTWMHEVGVSGRPWFKNLYMAPDETSGYAAWPLPGLRRAIELGEPHRIVRQYRNLEMRMYTLYLLMDSLLSERNQGAASEPH